MKVGEVNFNDLNQYNDSESCILTAVVFPDELDEKDVEDLLQSTTFLPEGKHIIAIDRIKENIFGDEGRWDYLIRFDHPEIQFNPIGRLRIIDNNGVNWCKWTSDFIVNFRKDYI